MFDVITIGSATRDALFRSKHFKVIKSQKFFTGKGLGFDLGAKIAIDEVYFSTGGAATNTAATFARQGFKTAVIARIGWSDVSGRAILEEMKKEKADTRFMQYDKKLSTAYSVILEHSSGERTILTHRGANWKLSAGEIPWPKLKSRWIYLSSLSGDLGIVRGAIDLKKKYKTKIAWNPGGNDLKLGLSKLRPYLKYIDVFIVNQEEAADLLKIPYQNTKKVFKKFDEMIGGIAVMTRGPKGVMVSDGKILWDAGTFKEKRVLDRTGAGDAFGSGFVAGLCKWTKPRLVQGVKYAIRLASANATSKVEHIGAKTGLITKKEFAKPRWAKLQIKSVKL